MMYKCLKGSLNSFGDKKEQNPFVDDDMSEPRAKLVATIMTSITNTNTNRIKEN